VQQLAKQQARRTGADDGDLSTHVGTPSDGLADEAVCPDLIEVTL
jgi:hypothetical protein